jgi:hypothetical protein
MQETNEGKWPSRAGLLGLILIPLAEANGVRTPEAHLK